MDFDFNSYLGSVTRSVTELQRDGKPARNVTLARSYDTTIGDLWDAVTNPQRLPRWFLPVSGDLRLGGNYQFEGNAGGTITDCEPSRFLAVTWEFAGGVSWVEVRLTPEGETQSRLTLSHICPVDDFWQKYGPGAVGVGWDLSLVALVLHLLGGIERFDEDAFSASAEGKAYITSASEDWGRAAIASGEDATHAEAAAQRTTAFYTGAQSQDD